MIRSLTVCALILASTFSTTTPVSSAERERVPIVQMASTSDAPVAQRNYDRATLEELQNEKAAALRPSDAFVIENGHVFLVNYKDAPRYVAESFGVTQILIHKRQLIALDNHGDIYLLNEDGSPRVGEWIKLGNSTVSIESDGQDLFALTTGSEFLFKPLRGVWVYQGYPGQDHWIHREVAFRDANVPGAVSLLKEDGLVWAVLPNGRKVQVSRPVMPQFNPYPN